MCQAAPRRERQGAQESHLPQQLRECRPSASQERKQALVFELSRAAGGLPRCEVLGAACNGLTDLTAMRNSATESTLAPFASS